MVPFKINLQYTRASLVTTFNKELKKIINNNVVALIAEDERIHSF